MSIVKSRWSGPKEYLHTYLHILTLSWKILVCARGWPIGTQVVHLSKSWPRYLGTHVSLFRNKRFMLDEMTQQNASKFAIFYNLCTYTKTQSCFFHFSFRATLSFPLINALVYVDIGKKNKVARNEKCKFGFSYI